MALTYEADRDGQGATQPTVAETPRFTRAGRSPAANTISASQARAARRREALSNEQAVAAWLRELAGRRR